MLRRPAALVLTLVWLAACNTRDQETTPPEHVLLITIDTLRADRVGAYGYARASTPALDSLAKNGARFDRAFAVAPITQTSHASLLTGRYPQGHGARHNGMRMREDVPTLAERFKAAGFATGAFVAAFPLDRRFGLGRGFDTYSDAMPRDASGRQLNERAGRLVVDDAIAWLDSTRGKRVFLWVHVFEPHAPYGDPSNPAFAGLAASDRYDREIAEADRQIARVLAALGDRRPRTLIVATADHGEAFGEHGEIGHSLFVYDTTLRVPLLMEGPGIVAGRAIERDVGLIDIAPTVAARAGLGKFDADGRDLSREHLEPADGTVAARIAHQYYAESFAPLLDFGWSPLRSVRAGQWKYIDAPRPELYEIEKDRGERENQLARHPKEVQHYAEQLTLIAGREPGSRATVDQDGRLAALGYVGRSRSEAPRSGAKERADPKDKVKVAAAIARITSGEARGPQLERELRAVLAEDPGNPQMNLRLAVVLAESNRCGEARARFEHAIRGKMPAADAHLGLAGCQAVARDFAGSLRTLREAERIEPGNPVITANIGLMLAESGRPADAIEPLRQALAAAPDLHAARFGLALALARINRRDEAEAAAAELLRRLPAAAPQRPEVERLLQALRPR